MRLGRVLAPRRDGIDFDALLGRNEHQLVQVPGRGVLDIGGGMRRHGLVQHRLMVEAGK